MVDVGIELLVGKVDEADRPFDKLTAEEVFLVEPEIVIDTVARTPFELAFAFRPQATHLALPAVLLQEMDLPAAVAAGPSATVTDEKSVVE